MSITTTTTQDPTFQQYQRFWVVTESLAPCIYDRSEREEAIAKFQRLLGDGDSPRFLGEQEDASLHDLSLSKPAISTLETAFRISKYRSFWIAAKDAVSQVFPRAELEAAIAEYQFQREHGESPRFLGEKADDSLHDLTELVTAFSSNQDR